MPEIQNMIDEELESTKQGEITYDENDSDFIYSCKALARSTGMELEVVKETRLGRRALPEEIVREMKSILEHIRDGALEHDQMNFHCGTAHCYAGHKEMRDVFAFDVKEYKGLYKMDLGKTHTWNQWLEPRLRKLHKVQDDMPTYWETESWGYAEWAWMLTKTEADWLFTGNSKLNEQFAMVRYLESGQRVQDDNGYAIEWFEIRNEISYESQYDYTVDPIPVPKPEYEDQERFPTYP